MRTAVHPKRLDTGVEEKYFDGASGGRVTFLDRLDILSYSLKQTNSPFQFFTIRKRPSAFPCEGRWHCEAMTDE